MGATIGTACAMGTASVVTGIKSVFMGWEEVGVPLTAPLMTMANAGELLVLSHRTMWPVGCKGEQGVRNTV